jgi:hypothetical protein
VDLVKLLFGRVVDHHNAQVQLKPPKAHLRVRLVVVVALGHEWGDLIGVEGEVVLG